MCETGSMCRGVHERGVLTDNYKVNALGTAPAPPNASPSPCWGQLTFCRATPSLLLPPSTSHGRIPEQLGCNALSFIVSLEQLSAASLPAFRRCWDPLTNLSPEAQLQFPWEGQQWQTPRGRLRGVSLPRGAFCWAPSPVVSRILWTAHGEVLGPLISTLEMTTSRLLPPGLAPVCFLAAHPQEPHPWVLKQGSAGVGLVGASADTAPTSIALPRVLSWWLSGYFPMFWGKECLAPTFPSRCQRVPDD